jgi:hypothetical protein
MRDEVESPERRILTVLRDISDARIIKLPHGKYVMETGVVNAALVQRLSELCWTMKCDCMLSMAGFTVLADGTYTRAERAITRPIRARTKSICARLRCGAQLRARCADVMFAVCSFRHTHFMPNFTVECASGGLSIICNLASVHVLDLIALYDHGVTDLSYKDGYLTISVAPMRTTKRAREESPTTAHNKRRETLVS